MSHPSPHFGEPRQRRLPDTENPLPPIWCRHRQQKCPTAVSAKSPDPSIPITDSENPGNTGLAYRSEEHTSELQSLMRISYAVFCLKKKTKKLNTLTKGE